MTYADQMGAEIAKFGVLFNNANKVDGGLERMTLRMEKSKQTTTEQCEAGVSEIQLTPPVRLCGIHIKSLPR